MHACMCVCACCNFVTSCIHGSFDMTEGNLNARVQNLDMNCLPVLSYLVSVEINFMNGVFAQFLTRG